MSGEANSGRGAGGTGAHGIVRELGGIVFGQLRHALRQRTELAQREGGTPATAGEPPVVAQLMIEIRSDGSRTIARGALNDLRNGESAQVHAEGRTPAELVFSLASSLLSLPAAVFKSVRLTREELSEDASPGVADPSREPR